MSARVYERPDSPAMLRQCIEALPDRAEPSKIIMLSGATRMGVKHFFARRPHILPAAIAAVMLLVALADCPYGYYRLLRVVVCAAAVFVTVLGVAWKRYWASWLFGIVAVLFNPLAPIHLTREIWRPTDIIVSALFLLSIVFLVSPLQTDNTDAGEQA